MADVVKCSHGHFYDRSVFIKCPHCEAGSTNKQTSTELKKEISQYAMEYLNSVVHSGSPCGTPDAMHRGELRTNQRNASEDLPTEARAPRISNTLTEEDRSHRFANGSEMNHKGHKQTTVEDEKTIGFSANNQKNYFVTGWLVCVEGPDKGHSFNLYYGYNTIGYSRSNQICLIEDVTVAKKVHCSVVYEDRKNRFYLVPEENQPTWLNGTLLERPAELNSGDQILLGKSELAFVAFCRDGRKWDKKDMQGKAK